MGNSVSEKNNKSQKTFKARHRGRKQNIIYKERKYDRAKLKLKKTGCEASMGQSCTEDN